MKSLSTSKKYTRILNYICAAVALVLIVLQFIPFWGCYQCSTCGEGRIISINEYVWLASDHKTGLTSTLQKYYIPGFAALDVVAISVFTQLAGIATVVFALLRPHKLTATIFAAISGLVCIIGYLLQPAYQMGQLWQLHLGTGIALTLLALTSFGITFRFAYIRAKAELQQ